MLQPGISPVELGTPVLSMLGLRAYVSKGNYFGVGCIATEQILDEEKLLNNKNPLNDNKPFMDYSVTVSSHKSEAGCTDSSCALENCNAYFCATIFGGVHNQLRVVFEILPKKSTTCRIHLNSLN